MAKKNAAPTKSQVVSAVAGATDLSKKQVGAVLESLTGQMKKALKGELPLLAAALVEGVGR